MYLKFINFLAYLISLSLAISLSPSSVRASHGQCMLQGTPGLLLKLQGTYAYWLEWWLLICTFPRLRISCLRYLNHTGTPEHVFLRAPANKHTLPNPVSRRALSESNLMLFLYPFLVVINVALQWWASCSCCWTPQVLKERCKTLHWYAIIILSSFIVSSLIKMYTWTQFFFILLMETHSLTVNWTHQILESI